MKTSVIVAIFLVFIIIWDVQGQYSSGLDQRDIAKDEASLNALNILVFGALDLSYARILSDQTSLGLSFFSKVFNKNEGDGADLSKVTTKNILELQYSGFTSMMIRSREVSMQEPSERFQGERMRKLCRCLIQNQEMR